MNFVTTSLPHCPACLLSRMMLFHWVTVVNFTQRNMVNRIRPAAPAGLITARPVKSNHLNRTYLTKWSHPKIIKSNTSCRKKVLTYISLERVKKLFPRIWIWNGGKRGIHWRVKSKICYWPERIQRVVRGNPKKLIPFIWTETFRHSSQWLLETREDEEENQHFGICLKTSWWSLKLLRKDFVDCLSKLELFGRLHHV